MADAPLHPKIKRAPVGIAGFEEITAGGFPSGYLILILGEPGAGKTIFASEFLAKGLLAFGENGLYVSLKKTKEQYYGEMKNFGWDFYPAEQQKKFAFIDASPVPSDHDAGPDVSGKKISIASRDFTIAKLLDAVKTVAKTISAKRIVIDSLSMLDYFFFDERERRRGILDIYLALRETGATCLLISDLPKVGLKARSVLPEEYLFHGSVLMGTILQGRTMERIIQIEKLLGTQIDRQPRPYRITEKGIEVYPRESVI